MTSIKWTDIADNRMDFLAQSVGLSDDLIERAKAEPDGLREELAMAMDGRITEFSPAAFAAIDWWATTEQPHPMNLEWIIATSIENGVKLGRAEGRDADDVADIGAAFAACVTYILMTVTAAGLDLKSLPDNVWDDDAD